MKNKVLLKKLLGFALVLAFGLIFIGCDDSSDDLVNVRVINNTGKAISDIRFTASNGTIITVEELARRGMGHRGEGHCWMSQDETYTLSWYCEVRGETIYAESGGRCGVGRRENPHQFRFRGDEESTIVLEDDDTWEFVEG